MFRTFSRFYYGWRIVAINFVTNAIETGVYYQGFSIFFLPISRDLQISRGATSLPFSLYRIITSFTSPILGLVVDKKGPAWVLFATGVVGGAGYILLRWSHTYLLFLLIFMFVISPAMWGLEMPLLAAISRWFVKKRSLALSIASLGYAFGGAALTPLVAVSVQSFGWRNSAVMAGVLIWLVVLPLTGFLRRSPEGTGATHSSSPVPEMAAQNPSQSPPVVRPNPESFTLRAAMKTPAYWFLSLSYGFRSMVGSTISLHLVAIMVWKGLDEKTAGLLVGAYSFFWIPSGLAMAVLADRWPKQRLAAIGTIISASGFLLLVLWTRTGVWQMILVFALLSANEGTWPLSSAMLVDQFGLGHFGLLKGTATAISSFLSIGTPYYGGWVFDKTGSYFWVVMPAIVLMGTAGLLNWFMPSTAPISRERDKALASTTP